MIVYCPPLLLPVSRYIILLPCLLFFLTHVFTKPTFLYNYLPGWMFVYCPPLLLPVSYLLSLTNWAPPNQWSQTTCQLTILVITILFGVSTWSTTILISTIYLDD